MSCASTQDYYTVYYTNGYSHSIKLLGARSSFPINGKETIGPPCYSPTDIYLRDSGKPNRWNLVRKKYPEI